MTLISGFFRFFFVSQFLAGMVLLPHLAVAKSEPVNITVKTDSKSPNLAPRFLGMSFESVMLLPQSGHYYFDTNDAAMVNLFKTLGIKSLRVGANGVDDPRFAVPQEQDIDNLFAFARAAEMKVIYSFRLKNGDPTNSARLASYVAARYADALDGFSIGNEPDFYLKQFDTFFELWKPHYDAILKAVPDAMFVGPSVSRSNVYALDLAKALFADRHLAMVSDHYYFLGSRPAAEKNSSVTRSNFLSDSVHSVYERAYGKIGAVLASNGVPYRIDEMNSCSRGGAKGSSDAYAATLWALDCTHWWAAHPIQGVNFHMGSTVNYYAAFVHAADGHGFSMRPEGYAFLAFSQGAHGRPLEVTVQTNITLCNFNAYAYQDKDDSIYVTLINKNFGETAQPASVSLQLPKSTGAGTWQRIDLVQANQDVAAKTDITLGDAPINSEGTWSGKWKKMKTSNSGNLAVEVSPASAAILHFSPAKP